MKKVLNTCTFVGIDDATSDERLTLSCLKSGGVIACIHKADEIIFHATITKASWDSMIDAFKEIA